MAKLTAKGVALPAEGYAFLRTKRPSFGGSARLYVMQAPAGPSLRMWPRRMPGRSEAFYQAHEFVRFTSKIYQLTDRELLEQYRRFSLGTFLLARDIYTAAVAGRLFSVTLADGRVLFSKRAKEVMSQSLDIVSMTNGAMLYRAPWGWDALLPGTPGYVLTINTSGLPEWMPSDTTASSVRSGILTGLDLRGAGQGSGATTLSGRRFCVDMTGTATSAVTYFLRIACGVRSLSSRLLFENVSQSGGYQVRLGFDLRVINRDGEITLYPLSPANYSVPAQGQTFAVNVSWNGVQIPVGDAAVSVTVTRYGASSEDTHNGIIGLYLVFWEWS